MLLACKTKNAAGLGGRGGLTAQITDDANSLLNQFGVARCFDTLFDVYSVLHSDAAVAAQ